MRRAERPNDPPLAKRPHPLSQDDRTVATLNAVASSPEEAILSEATRLAQLSIMETICSCNLFVGCTLGM
jgi:hypothetical protein